MRDNAVALVLTYAQAGALLEAANLGTNKRAEIGMSDNYNAFEAMQKVSRGMAYNSKVDGHVVLLTTPPKL
jgi:hypothetical protein